MKAGKLLAPHTPYADWGLLILRLTFATQLIWGTQDNVFSWEQMLEFRDFLAARGVPYPLLAAHISVYAQFVAGLCWIAGFATRPASLLMVINFIAALFIAHMGLPYEQNFPAINLLAVALCLFFTGPGRFSADRLLFKPNSQSTVFSA